MPSTQKPLFVGQGQIDLPFLTNCYSLMERTLEVGMLHCYSLLFLPNIVNWIQIVASPPDIPILGMTNLMGINADFWWFYPISDHMAAQVGVAEAWGYWGGWWTKDGSRPTSNRPDRPIITPTKYKHALLCISSLCLLLIMFTYQWSVWVPREWWDNFYRTQV